LQEEKQNKTEEIDPLKKIIGKIFLFVKEDTQVPGKNFFVYEIKSI
jgi:hypothetical protein